MKIALYCPNKALDDTDPSGDLIISRGIHNALNRMGHDCREIVRFRARWLWRTPALWPKALAALFEAFGNAVVFRPELWLTYHTYYKSPDVIGPWISRVLKIPYVLFQPMYSTKRRKDPGTRVGFYLNRIALKTCRHAFVNNVNDLEALARAIPRSKITYLPPGIAPEEFKRDEAAGRAIRSKYSIPHDAPLLMTAARLRTGVKSRSILYLLKSLALLTPRQPQPLLLIAGDGPEDEKLRAAAERFIPGRTIFAGRVDRSNMFRYYSAADIFVFPGIGESLGMVFLEAQACELPVVALDTAGVPQVVRRSTTALLVPEDDGRSMAHAIETLLSSAELRKRLGKKGCEFIRKERNLHQNYIELSRILRDIRLSGCR